MSREINIEDVFAPQGGWRVRILDLSADSADNVVEEVKGFATLMLANAFARRYVRDSIELCREPGFTSKQVLAAWFAYGENAEVVDGGDAGLLIVAARTSGGEHDTAGITLFLVAGDAKGVTRTKLSTLDAHAAANISFADVEVGADAVLGTVDAGYPVLEAVLDRARIGLAAEMLGAADAAFEMTAEYLKVRKQFGQLIGSFQSLQHRAAIMFTDLELTRSCVTAGLDALDRNANNVAELASLAKARAGETLHLVSNETVQMHGGIGMTDAHDSGLYMKRARVLGALYGSEAFHRDRYARLGGY